LHQGLLDLSPHQFASLDQIQSWSEIPWRDRLFDSIVVVQNYEIDADARRVGDHVTISDFSGPIHTNYPLLVLVEPHDAWRLSLIYDRRELPAAASNGGAGTSYRFSPQLSPAGTPRPSRSVTPFRSRCGARR